MQGGSFLSNQSNVKNKVSTEVRQKALQETALSKYFEQELRNQSTLREGNTSAKLYLKRELRPGSAWLTPLPLA